MKPLVLLLLATNGLLYTSAGDPTECDEGVNQKLQDGNAAFTGKFLNAVIKNEPNKNVIMSGFSVLQLIAQLALYAKGDTEKQLMKALNLPDKFNLRCVFPNVIGELKSENNVVLNLANKIFVTDAHPLADNFLKDVKQVFGSTPESLNFKNSQNAADRINQWVKNQTNNHIKDLAKPNMFDEQTRLVLANAIYFLGNWMIPFDKRSTVDRPFHIDSKQTVNIPVMHERSSFKYGESKDLDCKVLEMFYKGGKFSFVVFLPNKIDGLSNMLEKLQDHRKFNTAYHNTEEREVDVYLPKFKIESEFDLKPIMELVGITDVFDEFKSNLTDILKIYEPLYISAARQKTFGVVDEKGTEATSANVLGVGVPMSFMFNKPPTPIFKADHPFAFYILHRTNIIFGGLFVK